MLKLNNLRRLFAIMGTGITLASFSGCVKHNNKVTNENSKEEIEVVQVSESSTIEILEKYENEEFWWPIGSQETFESNNKIFASFKPEESKIVKNFISRIDILSEKKPQESHEGIDITTHSKGGITNVIASKSGIVVYPTEEDTISYINNDKNGTSYGNYVIIEHADGNYTLYAHLKENTISVKAGEIVEQGQVIGKLGNSGLSTGDHLHFEIRYGGNTLNRSVNPESYVTMDEPRLTKGPKSYISDEIEFISNDTVLSNAILILNKQNNWELKLADITLRIITNDSLINFLNAKSEQLGVISFTMDDIESYGIKEAILNNLDIEYSKTMH